MFTMRGAARGLAVAAAIGVAVVPSVALAQGNGPAEGALTVSVVVTGDAGGDPGAVSFSVSRQSSSTTVLDGTGRSTPQTFTLEAGSYLLVPSVADAAYVITDVSCRSQAGQGPNRPDFIIDGSGPGGGGDASCVIAATYTAPTPSGPVETTPTTTAPPSTTAPPATSTPGETTTTTAPAVTTTDQGALPPSGGGTASATPTGTMPVTGPGETTAVAIAALIMVLLGSTALTLARRH
jgi:hypothetical protein